MARAHDVLWRAAGLGERGERDLPAGWTDPSGQIGAVPDTATYEPTRTARLKPTLPSYGEPDETR